MKIEENERKREYKRGFCNYLNCITSSESWYLTFACDNAVKEN